MFKVYSRRWYFMFLPLAIIALGLIFMAIHGGFNEDVEFSGGTRVQIDMEKEFNNNEVSKAVQDALGVKPTVQKTGDNTDVIIKVKTIEGKENIQDEIFKAVKDKFGLKSEEPVSYGTLSPSFGAETKKSAALVTVSAVILMLIYITIRFEWRSALISIMALGLNVLVMCSVYLIFDIPVNTSFIAAILTILGYSINDTIIIFDRVRENMKMRKKETVPEVVEKSIWQTFNRSINTSVTTLITIVILFIMGVSSIREFALPIIIGVIIGTYTSVFITAPMWAGWKEFSRKRAASVKKKA